MLRRLALLCLALMPPVVLAQAPPQPTSVSGATPHVYKTVAGSELRLHVFAPPDGVTGSPRPAIVLFFGGGWTEGSITQFAPQARHLAGRGMVAILADYRVRGRQGATPFDAIGDAKSTMRWVRAHASTLDVDPSRIVAGGGSSGGHLALATAMIEGFDDAADDRRLASAPSAFVLFSPVVDTTIGTTTDQFGDRARDASPLHHMRKKLPPMLIVQAKADPAAPYSSVESFCEKAKDAGADCQLIGYEDAPHDFFNPEVARGLWYRDTLLEVDRFLTRMGYLPAPSPSEIR